MIETTKAEARKFADDCLDAYYQAFQTLAGPEALTQAQYREVLVEFFYNTFDAYIGGTEDRGLAMDRYQRWLGHAYPTVNAGQVFRSVDMVNAYT